jgi:hypothetical protein
MFRNYPISGTVLVYLLCRLFQAQGASENMELAEVRTLCDQLREVIAAGPGKNELALYEAAGIVSILQQAAAWDGPHDKLVTIRGWLAIWFSQRAWRQYGDHGEICKQSLINDILVAESYWDRKTTGHYAS